MQEADQFFPLPVFEPLSSALSQAQVFVESAVKRGKEDKDNYLVQYVRGVFKHLPVENVSRAGMGIKSVHVRICQIYI